MQDLFNTVWPYVAALIPSVGVLWLFAVVMKHIVEGDRRERAALAEWDADHGARDSAAAQPHSERDAESDPVG